MAFWKTQTVTAFSIVQPSSFYPASSIFQPMFVELSGVDRSNHGWNFKTIYRVWAEIQTVYDQLTLQTLQWTNVKFVAPM